MKSMRNTTFFNVSSKMGWLTTATLAAMRKTTFFNVSSKTGLSVAFNGLSFLLLLTALIVFGGCDEASRYSDDRTGASVSVIDRVTIGNVARTQLKISLGDNQSGYIQADVRGYSLFYPEYLTIEQIDNFHKRLVCDVVASSGSLATIRCGWTQYDPNSGYWSGVLGYDWGGSTLATASLSDTLRITITIGDRKEGELLLYIDGDGCLY